MVVVKAIALEIAKVIVMAVALQLVVVHVKEVAERIVNQIAVGIAKLGVLDVVALVKEAVKEDARTPVAPLAKIVVLEDNA